jgi:hypothetical protein
LPAGFERYFKDGESRVPDRAAIFHPELDGSAVMDELGLIYGLSRTSEDFHNQLDSTSPCRWNQPRFKDWLLKRGESEEIVRGLVLIDAKLIDAGLAAKLETIAANLRKLQLGL